MKRRRVIVSIYDEPHDWSGQQWYLPEGTRVAHVEISAERDPDLSWHDHFYDVFYGTESEVRAYWADREKSAGGQE